MSIQAKSEADRKDAAPPLFRHHIFFCVNTRSADDPRGCCAAKGSAALRSHMKERARELGLRRVRVNTAGCLDRCKQGPTVVIYPEGIWYRCRTIADADRILETHVRDGGRVPDLMLKQRKRRQATEKQ
jgi:(2Fe-2S) ferredoxin